ncbi:hypothetical protein JOB18_016733 [Solea senegalensis]|uniref:Uncharacterized protein n=1 Tax=Solea senegalensis TaxID=28829 RepID=A0AAV6SYY7_SOLSE|nr:hypothetical protein JOB18_016733 [Solea senegalensis]
MFKFHGIQILPSGSKRADKMVKQIFIKYVASYQRVYVKMLTNSDKCKLWLPLKCKNLCVCEWGGSASGHADLPCETRRDEHLNYFLGSTMLNLILN